MTRRPRHRVSVLGLGAMGLRHARVIAGLPRFFELVGAYDLSEAVGAPPYVRRFASEADAVAAADVVVVATPIEAHAEAALRALGSGRDVLVEKPLCDSKESAVDLLAAGARHGARVFVGHSERFNPVVRALVRLLRDDPALAIDLRRVGPSRRIPHGVLLNLGVHDLDLARYLGGGDLTVRSALAWGADETSDDIAHVLFETSGGAAGHIHVDRTRPRKDRTLTVVTSRWVYEGDLLAHRLVRISRRDGIAVDVPLSIAEPLVAQASAFAGVLRGAPPRELATGADGARAVELAVVAALRSRVDASSSASEKLSRRVRA